jgi:hypothetical protein
MAEPDVSKELVFSLPDGVRVFRVDGNKVRNGCSVEFCLGGHGLVYGYIPEDEMWVEDLPSEDDWWHNAFHEMVEYELMAGGMGYDEAHELASEKEAETRSMSGSSSRTATRTKYEKVEPTTPGSKNHYKVTYHDGQEKWVDAIPGRGEPGRRNERVMKKKLTKPSVVDSLKRLDNALTRFEDGAGKEVLQNAVEKNEVSLDRNFSKKVNRLFVKTVRKQEGDKMGDKTKEGLGAIKDHVNRHRRDSMDRFAGIAERVARTTSARTASEVVNEMARQIGHFATKHETALSKVFGGRWTPFKPYLKEDDDTIVAKFIKRGSGSVGVQDSMAGFRLRYDRGSDTYAFTPFSVIDMGPVKWGRESEDFYVEDLGDVSKLAYLYETAR